MATRSFLADLGAEWSRRGGDAAQFESVGGLASLRETFPGIDWERQASYFFARVIEHGRRRAEEMREAAQTVREVGLEPWSADGAARRRAWIADLADAGAFDRGADPSGIVDWRVEADRILATLAPPRSAATHAATASHGSDR